MRPSPILLKWLAVWSFLAFLLFFVRYLSLFSGFVLSQVEALWWGLGVGLTCCALFDALQGARLSAISVRRDLPKRVPLDAESHVRLQIFNPFKRVLELSLTEDCSDALEVPSLPVALHLGPQESKTILYAIRPVKRGLVCFGRSILRVNSRFRFWQHLLKLGHESETRVYPNFCAIAQNMPLYFKPLSQAGIHLMPRRGEGLEFHQLREFREGDALRQIDWKASARHAKPISREYQDEGDQAVIFLLDCGRRLRAKDDTLSHFDHALNALLLTADLALKQGDATGLMSFAGEGRWLKPVKGASAINLLLKQLYDLHSSTESSDFLDAAKQLMQRQQKRALIILISNVREEDSEDLIAALRLLRKQHRVMIASLREHFFERCLVDPVNTFDEALRYSGTTVFLGERDLLLKKLRSEGVVIVDAAPQHLHVHLVQEYLRMKRGGVI